MTIEDNFLRWEGLDPAKVDEIANNLVHILDTVKGQTDRINTILREAANLVAIIETEMPRVEKTIADVRSQIAAYEAKQKQLRGG